jgi:hypothetical protein
MSELNQNPAYLKASLNQAILDLGIRQSGHTGKSATDILRDSRVIETMLYVLDRLEKIERGLDGK